MNDECNHKIKETRILNTLIIEEARTNNLLKENIRKINKKISDVEVKFKNK